MTSQTSKKSESKTKIKPWRISLPLISNYKSSYNLASDAHGMPVRVAVTQGTTADCKQAIALIEDIHADYLLADRAYDTDAIVNHAVEHDMIPCIPPKRNRKVQRDYDKDIYKLRHLVENAILHLKQWRGIATRYAKNTASFLAAIHIRCIHLWGLIS